MAHNTLAHTKSYARNLSRRLIISYVLDWLLVIIIAVLGAVFHLLKNGNRRPFALQNPSITYPLHGDTVTSTTLILLSLFMPACLIALICLIGPIVAARRRRAPGNPTPSITWRSALRELHHTWLGLFLSLATAFMTTEGLKDLAGKPRPHLLAACRPDLSAASIAANQVGGLNQAYNSQLGATPILVTSGICAEKDQAVLRDAFASWPSGHSSFSMAGLVFLALFLCGKFYVKLPLIWSWIQRSGLPGQSDNASERGQAYRSESAVPLQDLNAPKADASTRSSPVDNLARDATTGGPENSEPPVYLVLLCLYVPIGLALFICVSRWFDFHHHGIDIFSGALIGIICAVASFWWFYVLGGLGGRKSLRFGLGGHVGRSEAMPDWRQRGKSSEASALGGVDLEEQGESSQGTTRHDEDQAFVERQ